MADDDQPSTSGLHAPKVRREEAINGLDVFQQAVPGSIINSDLREEDSFAMASLLPLPSSHDNSDSEEAMQEGKVPIKLPWKKREDHVEGESDIGE